MKSPAYQWYPKDIIGSERVAFLSLIEEGAYRRALDFCWLHGSVPSDPDKLALLIGKKCTTKIASAILHMFQPHPTSTDRLTHDRLEKERLKQIEFSARQSDNGKRGGRPKQKPKETQAFNLANPTPKPKKALHLHLQSASAEENINTKNKSFKKLTEEEFYKAIAQFKDQYPKDMLRAFYDYWREKDGNGKMLFQLKRTWELNLRLASWKRNELNFSKPAGALVTMEPAALPSNLKLLN